MLRIRLCIGPTGVFWLTVGVSARASIFLMYNDCNVLGFSDKMSTKFVTLGISVAIGLPNRRLLHVL